MERQIVRGSAAAVTTMLTATQGTETAGMWLVGSVYNVCTPHRSLGKRTSAQAAGLTDHRWTMHELLTFPVPGSDGAGIIQRSGVSRRKVIRQSPSGVRAVSCTKPC